MLAILISRTQAASKPLSITPVFNESLDGSSYQPVAPSTCGSVCQIDHDWLHHDWIRGVPTLCTNSGTLNRNQSSDQPAWQVRLASSDIRYTIRYSTVRYDSEEEEAATVYHVLLRYTTVCYDEQQEILPADVARADDRPASPLWRQCTVHTLRFAMVQCNVLKYGVVRL